jgi:BirA family biotin operon repressor/biotin-[acetyl-CoA-carboxylase] ligase
LSSRDPAGGAEGQGARVHHFVEVGSTMAEAARLAAKGEAAPFWVMAEQQKAGRGRQGRSWHSPPGNLYATLFLAEPCEAARGAELGFVAGLALHDAVTEATGLAAPRLALKWPNDLLLDGAKIAGLLLEGQTAGARFSAAIGFGVNIIAAPSDTPYPAAALAMAAPGLNRDALFKALRAAMERRLEQWRREGFAAIRDAWRACAAFRGQEVTVRLAAGTVNGVFEDIDGAGRLLLLTSEGSRVIDAGDLYFGKPAR